MRVALKSGFRKMQELRVAAAAVHFVDEELRVIGREAPDVFIEHIARRFGDVVAIYDENRQLQELLEIRVRDELQLNGLSGGFIL